ncbi:hypothetical protein BaRGS_00038424, partial [Batillaria attramentaria]
FTMSQLLILLALVLTAAHAQDTTSLPCHTNEHARGCHATFGLDIAYQGLFDPLCSVHSLCYSCGADYGHTKTSCDQAFRGDLDTACQDLADPDPCRFHADNVYRLMIRVIGTSFFHAQYHTEPFCIEHWVPGCLPSTGETTTAALVGK